jgi:hypothetical protein
VLLNAMDADMADSAAADVDAAADEVQPAAPPAAAEAAPPPAAEEAAPPPAVEEEAAAPSEQDATTPAAAAAAAEEDAAAAQAAKRTRLALEMACALCRELGGADAAEAACEEEDFSASDAWACGANASGALGTGDALAALRPKRLRARRPWAQIALGDSHGAGACVSLAAVPAWAR